jgi:hypothetical protein
MGDCAVVLNALYSHQNLISPSRLYALPSAELRLKCTSTRLDNRCHIESTLICRQGGKETNGVVIMTRNVYRTSAGSIAECFSSFRVVTEQAKAEPRAGPRPLKALADYMG